MTDFIDRAGSRGRREAVSEYRCEGCNCQWGTGHEPGCSRKAVRLLGTAETEQTILEGQDQLRRLKQRKGVIDA